MSKIINILNPKGVFLSYYPEGKFERMQKRKVSGKTFSGYAGQLPKDEKNEYLLESIMYFLKKRKKLTINILYFIIIGQ